MTRLSDRDTWCHNCDRRILRGEEVSWCIGFNAFVHEWCEWLHHQFDENDRPVAFETLIERMDRLDRRWEQQQQQAEQQAAEEEP